MIWTIIFPTFWYAKVKNAEYSFQPIHLIVGVHLTTTQLWYVRSLDKRSRRSSLLKYKGYRSALISYLLIPSKSALKHWWKSVAKRLSVVAVFKMKLPLFLYNLKYHFVSNIPACKGCSLVFSLYPWLWRCF